MNKVKLGFLPLYIKLYDDHEPYMRERIEAFYAKVAGIARGLGIDVITAPVCRRKEEFADAMRAFEDGGAEGLLTLHLAYSPSLESIDAICGSRLPILVLDVTETFEFGPGQLASEISYNHGIHGVQDLCCMLTRRGMAYDIVAGHYESRRVADKIVSWSKAVRGVAEFKSARAGIIGKPFVGMGDFQMPFDAPANKFGIKVVEYDAAAARRDYESLGSADIQAELSNLKDAFDCSGVGDGDSGDGGACDCGCDCGGSGGGMLTKTARTNIVINRWIEREKLVAFTANFLDVRKGIGLDMMPFTAASMAMSRGIGYAGEGDVLTAVLNRALASAYGKVSFTEMFCPDWKDGGIYLNHMGEMNIALTAGKPRLMQRPLIYSDIGDCTAPAGLFMPGKAQIVNLAPSGDGCFSLIICKGEMLAVEGEDNMAHTVHGWFKPEKSLDIFLEEYSRHGGTHHSALVYGDLADSLACFGKLLGCSVFTI